MESIKLSMLFTCFEYEQFIRNYFLMLEQKFENFIEITSREKEWGTDFNFLGLSIALLRPIYSLTSTSDLWCNPSSSDRAPIIICNYNLHFTAAVKISDNARVVVPRHNQLLFLKEPLVTVDFYN